MNDLIRKFSTVIQLLKMNGWRGIAGRISYRLQEKLEKRKVERWLMHHGSLSNDERQNILSQIDKLSYKPLISIITPVYNVEEKWLRLAIGSVLKQLYANWELCIAEDCSPSPHIREILQEYAARDKRIKIVYREQNGHISAASNSALEIATGEFCAFLDHDDELTEDALFYLAKEVNDFSSTDMIYSDEDMIGENGGRYLLKFKPDWSRDLFYSVNYVTHFAAYRTEILRKIGGFRKGFEGSQDYDLALRVIEQIPENQIRHIPRILYHWRAIKGSLAYSIDEKPYARERAGDAIRSHFERCGIKASVGQSVYNLHRVSYALQDDLPKISLIVLTGDTGSNDQANRAFLEQTDYDNFEIIPVSGTGNEAAAMNRAVSQSTGHILCFTDANLTAMSRDWLKEMASFAYQQPIGAVGAKLLYPNGTVLGGGLVLGGKALVNNAHQGFPADMGGNMGRIQLICNFSAVSISCLAVRRELFDSVGGFDSENLPNRFYDADFCLKLQKLGYRNVFNPFAELTKTDGKIKLNPEKRPSAKEIDYFSGKWREVIDRDPFHNPNLSKKDASFSIDV